MDATVLYYALAGLLIVAGLAGVVLPALPGLPLTFCGMLLAAWADRFAHIGWPTLLALALLTALSIVADFAASALGAKRVGASGLAVAGSLAGTVVGLLFVPWGIVLGPLLGAVAGELVHARRLGQAAKVGLGTGLGLLVGVALKVGLAVAMLALFLTMWFI
ncbi:MAG: DUF456 family protein [Pseudoxanthomonas sp.]